MFRALVNFSLSNRLFVLAAALLMTAYGLITLSQLPVDVFPDLNKPTVTINIEAGGLAPEEVEQLVVFPIETCLLYTSPSPRDRTRSRMPSSA